MCDGRIWAIRVLCRRVRSAVNVSKVWTGVIRRSVSGVCA